MPDKLTERQQSVLAAIRLDPGATLEEIGRRLGVSRERVRQVAVVLEARGIIRPRTEERAEAVQREKAVIASKLVRLRFLIRKYKRMRTLNRHRQKAGLPKSGVLTRYPMPGPESICLYEGCDRPVGARGYCDLHYIRLRETGLLWVRRITQARCSDCGHPTYARGYCRVHYNAHRARGDLQSTQPPKFTPAAGPRYPRIELAGVYWILKTKGQDGMISERKFIDKPSADRALQALARKGAV